MKIQLDMYQTLAVAVLVLLLGNYLKKKIYFLQKFCIPAPVIGGLIFAIMTCICYVTGIAEFSFNDTLREVCLHRSCLKKKMRSPTPTLLSLS